MDNNRRNLLRQPGSSYFLVVVKVRLRSRVLIADSRCLACQ
jgi:hypothetical protein